METIADLIDAAKAKTGSNFTDIGERLDRSKQLITNWRSGAKVPTDGDVMALARMAGQNADKWLAIAQAARTDGEARSRWESIAKRLATTAALLAIMTFPALPRSAQAATGWVSSEPVVCIMRNVRWWGRLLGLWIRSKLSKPRRPRIEALSC